MALGQSTRAESPQTAAADASRCRWVARLAAPWRAFTQFFAFAARHRLWTACMLAFILVWTVELFIVQSATLVFANEIGPRFTMWAPKIRLTMDVMFVSMLAVTLRRRWLVVAAVAAFCAHLGLLTYYDHFLQPLSLMTILGQWREAVRVGELGIEVFPTVPAMLLLGALAVKLTLLAVREAEMPSWQSRSVMGVLLLVGYLAAMGVTNHYDPLRGILTKRGVGRLGFIRGYLGPWFAEWYYLKDDELLARAISRRHLDFDRITPVEADIPIHRKLVILQAESLDTNILDYRVDGVEVTPFLNRLRKASMFYRVEAQHANGSSDADFCVLNGVPASPNVNTYMIPGYPYENTTPQILAECGFESYSFHGMTGDFYGRRRPYEQIGFTGIRFQEDLMAEYGLEPDEWGLRDTDVLRVAAEEMRAATVPTCQFIITLTTHLPYTLLRPSDREIFRHPASRVEHYFNNMRYLDNCLRDYITSLGDDATVLIYGDHPTEDFEGFTADRQMNPRKEFVPALIHDTGQDLSQVQKTRDDPRSTDGTWTLVDVANYLRDQVKRSCGTPAAKPEENTAGEHARAAEK